MCLKLVGCIGKVIAIIIRLVFGLPCIHLMHFVLKASSTLATIVGVFVDYSAREQR